MTPTSRSTASSSRRVCPRRLAGLWPDLGATRIIAVTASQGSSPERQAATDADVFQLTLDPGTTVTYVAESRRPICPSSISGIPTPTRTR